METCELCHNSTFCTCSNSTWPFFLSWVFLNAKLIKALPCVCRWGTHFNTRIYSTHGWAQSRPIHRNDWIENKIYYYRIIYTPALPSLFFSQVLWTPLVPPHYDWVGLTVGVWWDHAGWGRGVWSHAQHLIQRDETARQTRTTLLWIRGIRDTWINQLQWCPLKKPLETIN